MAARIASKPAEPSIGGIDVLPLTAGRAAIHSDGAGVKTAPFLDLVLAGLVVIAIGWRLVGGRGILLPVITAEIPVHVMLSAAVHLGGA